MSVSSSEEDPADDAELPSDGRDRPRDAAAHFRLSDDHDRHLGARSVRLHDHRAALWEGLFDTRSHVERYAGDAGQAALLAELGTFLGAEVLCEELMERLAAGVHERTLVVHLPATRAWGRPARVFW